MFVFIPGSVWPMRFGPAATVTTEISIRAVTYMFARVPALSYPNILNVTGRVRLYLFTRLCSGGIPVYRRTAERVNFAILLTETIFFAGINGIHFLVYCWTPYNYRYIFFLSLLYYIIRTSISISWTNDLYTMHP